MAFISIVRTKSNRPITHTDVLRKSLFLFALFTSAVLSAPQGDPNAVSVTTGTATGTSTGGTYATIPATCSALAAAQTQTCYDLASLFPTVDKWMPWDCLASMNRAAMVQGWDGGQDGPTEADDVVNAIQTTAQAAGFDP